ncbi:hypothetical protein LUZ60_013919 [Juncus effusus]|nr:hypothetical protein LUZ60_013919 [Juncus effusus]
MAIRVYVLFAVVVLVGVFTGGAQAQLLGLNLLNITGIVPCSIGGSINAANSPVFPYAGVQLVCNGNVISSTTTNSNGVFSIVTGLTTSLLNLLTSGCKIVVNTPLVNCNVALPSTGTLQSGLLGGLGGLGGLGSLVNGLLGGILNLGTQGFNFLP